MSQTRTHQSPSGLGQPAEDLTFTWPSPKRWYQSRLLRFLTVSLLGHLLAFQLFQVVTRETVTAPERERELQFLSSDNPDHQIFLQAIEAEVPLAALSHQLLASDDLRESPYQSAFRESRVSPKEPARWAPPHAPVIPKLNARTPSAPAASSSAAAFPGKILFSPSLGERLSTLPPLPSSPTGKLLESPTFLVGVSADGAVQFLFLEHSTGDSEADATAEQTLRRTTFKKAGNATEATAWGEATLVWRSGP